MIFRPIKMLWRHGTEPSVVKVRHIPKVCTVSVTTDTVENTPAIVRKGKWKSMDKISVIVPVFNLELWVKRCVSSIMAQTYQNLEILLVDDGSSDSSFSIMERLAAEDPRIKVLHKENGGLPSARLYGIAAATGDWITFVDGDDEIEPQMYERLLKNARDYGADISHCGQVMVYPNGHRTYYFNSGVVRVQDTLLGLRDLLEETLVQPSVCNKLYKRSLFYDLDGKYTEEIWNNEDMLLNYYLFSRAQSSVFEDFCPYLYMLREGSLSRRKPNAHTIYDPILVKQRILRDCMPELREDVHRAMAATCLFAYAQLCRGMEKEYAEDRKKVRAIIREQLRYIRFLTPKNAAMVLVVSFAPFVFHGVYGFYYRYLKNRDLSVVAN